MPVLKYTSAASYAVEDLARCPASRLSWARARRSVVSVMRGLAKFKCRTMSNTCSGALGRRCEPLNLVAHQLNHVVSDWGHGDHVHIVCPVTSPVIKRDAAFLMQRLQKLYDKEGIPVRLVLEERGEWPRLSEVTVQSI